MKIVVYYGSSGTPIGNTPWGFRLGKPKIYNNTPTIKVIKQS